MFERPGFQRRRAPGSGLIILAVVSWLGCAWYVANTGGTQAAPPTPQGLLTPTHTPTDPPGDTATPTPTAPPTEAPPTATATSTPSCAPFSAWSTDVPRPLIDHGVVTSTLIIPSGPTISALEVIGLNIAHTYPADLQVYLTSPEQTRIELFVAICGGDDWTANNTGFTLVDGAATMIGTTCPPGWGPYRASGLLGPLAGERSAGTWILEIIDAGEVDIGTLHSWGLRIHGVPCPLVTPCPVVFTDVPPSQPFYPFIRCLACRNIVSGYSDGTFRPGANVTRGQLSKIIANAAGLTNAIPSTQQTFSDVSTSNAFWVFIERLAGAGAISGYACGGPGEPCDPQNRPYFRWGNNATRGQISKIVAVAAALPDPVPSTRQTFADVPPPNPFWLFIEQLAGRAIINGYTCGGPGEPCDPLHRPYFRWGANATRGQLSKIAANTFFPVCEPLRGLRTED